MKRVRKGQPPQGLIRWIAGHRNGERPTFNGPGFPKADVRNALLAEQGFICPYCMIEISDATCHIEHIKPQSQSKAEDRLEETVAYRNLLACYPGKKGDQNPGFGAYQKGDRWSEEKFLSPLVASCENRFRFSADGDVEVANKSDKAAKWTLQVLGLKCEKLCEFRQEAIRAAGVTLDAEEALSITKAKRLARDILLPKSNGALPGYCIAISQAAKEYVAILTKKAAKKRHARTAIKQRRK